MSNTYIPYQKFNIHTKNMSSLNYYTMFDFFLNNFLSKGIKNSLSTLTKVGTESIYTRMQNNTTVRLFYCVITVQVLVGLLIVVLVIAATNLIAIPLKKIPFFGKQVSVPFDMIVSRLIEILNSIPTLFLILMIIL